MNNKGGEIITDKEVISQTVSMYMAILRIKQADDRDREIENKLRELRVLLEAFGIAVEDLRID